MYFLNIKLTFLPTDLLLFPSNFSKFRVISRIREAKLVMTQAKPNVFTWKFYVLLAEIKRHLKLFSPFRYSIRAVCVV